MVILGDPVVRDQVTHVSEVIQQYRIPATSLAQ